ncbi:aldehyde dehydrogenase [Nocardioides aromaticivorans]|uniref:Aldehyde dehydrogenase n=1 Tax=Nocardioides aromaticivorans TaxID=200618 RepID=A0ABX7PI26_9ACTN|nr:aldehyde dehydrogenase family protein [Nocardioides aromaticivorans]QSR25367.1 aldehyde dehydrogenase [Nocardioides aromaticivorans]
MTGTTTGTIPQRADQIAAAAQAGAKAWSGVSLAKRRELLQQFAVLVEQNASEWVRIAAEVKGLDPASPNVGEEWTSGPWATLYYAGHLVQSIVRLEAGQSPTEGFEIRSVPGGRVAVEVLPHSVWDRLLLSGFSAEVWCEPGVSADEVRASAGLGLREPEAVRGTCVVLGAGNITSIAPLDALYVLYADNRSVALKLNPVTDPLLPVFEAIFKPFIDLGVVQVFTSDLELGAAVIAHPDIDAVHMTGSEATHDAIVWGPGAEGAANKAAGTPRLRKPITSELGGVAPIVVVPGRWSRRDLEFQARHVATMRLHNSGSNCVAGQVLVVSADWKQKDAFLAAVRRALASAPARPAWYPGTPARIDAARNGATPSEALGGTPERTLLPALDPTVDEPSYSMEYFGPVLGVTELSGTGADFLQRAIDFSNDRLRGTLGANILIHPREQKAIGAAAFEQLLAGLRYGTIAVNAWTGVGYLSPFATWGAFPGHTPDDIQSGHGVVHNGLLLARPERTVVRGPFRPFPRSWATGSLALTPVPPWFVHNRTAATTGERLVRFSVAPRWRKLPGVFASALRG